ncbi:Laminin subunit gamma-1-like 1 [Homarus americanus]|uniref:Laminin subunit gamma-1-like 1 n=1 Tax=Homarus americanus TaxID=6706 RepID=A0A8J5N2A7_HOMAM|nr:Laminin subunit gamma-1-like 1 [Homarus americanus]
MEESTGRPVSLNYNAITQSLAVSAPGRDKVYFCPDRFLGDQRASYNHKISFFLRVGELGPQSSTEDIVLEGAGLTISAPIFAQGNSLPSTQKQEYIFHLHENSKFGWSPRLTSRDFISLLSNLTAIKIRGTYTYDGRGFVDDVRLETARRGVFGVHASWIEMCTCPEGYVGQYCESCAPGYRHNPANGGPFAACIPCNCNNHADICDSETGRCICQHNTAGEQCERCGKGYYGNAYMGHQVIVSLAHARTVVRVSSCQMTLLSALNAPQDMQLCTDSFFGDPKGRHGPPRPCETCDCNGNIDPNAVANCNRTTGECLKCIYHTGGFYCDQCLSGFYGDALALPKGDCRPCRCNSYGTLAERYGPPVCDQVTGQCQCKPHVTGLKCNECEAGFWNLTSGVGCEPCGCDLTGALNGTCDVQTGQCFCQVGVVGQKCDMCEPYHYGFSRDGCQPCDCDPIGSAFSVMLLCRENVDGRRCDRCRENTFDKQAGCIDCPPCYSLVLDSVSIHRERLAELERLLADIVSNPTVLNDEDFEETLATVISQVEQLWDDAREAAHSGGDKSVAQHIVELEERIKGCGASLALMGEFNITQAEDIIQRAREALTYRSCNSKGTLLYLILLPYSVVEENSFGPKILHENGIFCKIYKDFVKSYDNSKSLWYYSSTQNAQIYLDVQGNDALNKAFDRSNQFGQQSALMSDIAREARSLADSQEDSAKSIEQVAYDARNTSNEAFLLARKAIDDQRDITDIIKASSIAIPPIDAAELKAQAAAITREAERLKAETQELMESRRFDKQVQESRGEAEDALIRVAEIEKLIVEAEARTRDAEDALMGAESDAKNARDIAKEAQKTANDASEQAGDVRLKADATKVEASSLKDEADQLASRVAGTDSQVSTYEEQAEEDYQQVMEAQEKANQAKDRADDASARVREAYEVVQEILDILERSPDLDPSELDLLEQRLEEAWQTYYQSGVETTVTELTEARSWQKRQITLYEKEIRQLQIEVINIEEIKISLPEGCYSQTKLEA